MLTPDGRHLDYTSIELRVNARVVHDQVTGEWKPGPLWTGDSSFLGPYPRQGEGQRLGVYRVNLQGSPPNYLNGRYLVRRGDGVIGRDSSARKTPQSGVFRGFEGGHSFGPAVLTS